MADIFISYKKEDRAYAERVANAFAEDDLTVWWDNDIHPREAWDKTIDHELEACSAVVVLWSELSVESDWVRAEAHAGLGKGKLAPAMIRTCKRPIAFSLTQTVDLTRWTGDRSDPNWRKLLAWIADLRAPQPVAPGAPAAAPNRYRAVIGNLPAGDPVVDGAFVNQATPAGTVFRDFADSPAMRIVARGAFVIGSPPNDPDRANVEGPQKRIDIPQPFAIGVYPVTVGEYARVMGSVPAAPPVRAAKTGWFAHGPSSAAPPAANLDPAVAVSNVSFDDASRFAERLSAATGKTYRLPSEAEWEYACCAGSPSRYAWGDTIEAHQAHFRAGPLGTGPTGPAVPGAFAPNQFGLYDMHGNVREWTRDVWRESYDLTPINGDPVLDGQASMRVVRGGGWSDPAPLLRSAARSRATESIRSNLIGFRLVRVLA